jgi:hypothetical protein
MFPYRDRSAAFSRTPGQKEWEDILGDEVFAWTSEAASSDPPPGVRLLWGRGAFQMQPGLGKKQGNSFKITLSVLDNHSWMLIQGPLDSFVSAFSKRGVG